MKSSLTQRERTFHFENSLVNNAKKIFKEMKKIEYSAPEMEIVDLKLEYNILQYSSGGPTVDPEPSDE